MNCNLIKKVRNLLVLKILVVKQNPSQDEKELAPIANTRGSLVRGLFKSITNNMGAGGLIWPNKQQGILHNQYKPIENEQFVSYNEKIQQTYFQFRSEYNSYPLELIIQLVDETQKVKSHNQTIYGENLLVYMTMAGVFTEKFAMKAKPDSLNVPKKTPKGQKIKFEPENQAEINMDLSLNFKEFYKAQLGEIQFEQKSYKGKLMTYFSKRGKKRELERRKFKTLGELQILKNLHTQLFQRQQDHMNQQSVNQLEIKSTTKPEISEKTKQTETKSDAQKLLPDMDSLFLEVVNEFQALRGCQLSHENLIVLMDLKNCKSVCQRTLSFWQGVCRTLNFGLQMPLFKQSDYMRQFLSYATSKLEEEQMIQQVIIQEHQQTKQLFDKFNVQIGKLKAYQLVTCFKQPSETNEYLNMLSQRIDKLQLRLHNLEINLIRQMQESIEKKRCQHLYFTNSGRKSAYKCITKSIAYEHILEYLMMNLTKVRIYELVYLTCQEKSQDQKKQASTSELDLISNSIQMQRYSELSLKKQSFQEFKDELMTIIEEERLSSEAPKVPLIQPLEKSKIVKSLPENVKVLMNNFYARQQAPDFLLKQFEDFFSSNLRFATFDLVGTMSFQTLDIENSGQLIFDFTEIENDSQQHNDLIGWISQMSCSLRDTYFQSQIEKLKQDRSRAHKTAQKDFQLTLSQCNDKNYLTNYFDEKRQKIFSDFIQCLRQANKGNLLNYMDMLTLSMPLEYSLMNNYWLIQGLKFHLRQLEGGEKFNQIQAKNAPLLLRQRIPEIERSSKHSTEQSRILINKDFIESPIKHTGANSTTSFQEEKDIPSQTGNSHKGEPQISAEEKERIDFQHQFLMCKGLDLIEDQVKQEIFGDIQDMIEVTQQQLQIENGTLATVLQSKETINDMKKVREFLHNQIKQLASTELLVNNYKETRLKHLDNIKVHAILCVFRGAVKYLECLTYQPVQELQEYSVDQDNQEEINSNLNKETSLSLLYDSVRAAYEKFVESHEDIASKLEPREFPDPQQFRVSQQNGVSEGNTLSISVTKKSYTSKDPVKSKQKNKAVVKKKKTKLKPHQQAELDLITFLSQKYQLIQLLIMSENFTSAEMWFDWCSQQIDYRQSYTGRLESALNYLNSNSRLPKSQAYRTIYEDELGCRVVQDVLVGALVDPVLAFKTARQQGRQNKPDVSDTPLDVPIDEDKKLFKENKSETALTDQQVTANYLLQFMNQLLKMDSKITCKQILKNDKLFTFLQKIGTGVSHLNSKLRIQNNLAVGFGNWLNVFEIKQTPKTHYLHQYKMIHRNVVNEFMQTVFKTDEDTIHLQFFQILNKCSGDLLQVELNKVNMFFGMANVAEADKLDFQTASVKIKKQFFSQLRTIKQMTSLEDNRKVAQSHFTVSENQERRMEYEIASLILVIKMYFFKE